MNFDNLKFWEEKKKECPAMKFLAIVGAVAVISAAAYFVYKFFTPNYLEDFDDDEFDFLEDDDTFEINEVE